MGLGMEIYYLGWYSCLLELLKLFFCDSVQKLTGERIDVLISKQNLYFKWGFDW